MQTPASAQFDGMPRSAIDAGVADVIAEPGSLASRVVSHPELPPAELEDSALSEKTQSALEKVCVVLRAQTGHDFSQYKRSSLQRRIERRMGLHQIDSLNRYVGYLRESPQEADLLFKELLIGVTSFFRDPVAWEHLRSTVIPALFKERTPGTGLRAWVAGCSTGEEAYSLAIVFREAVAELPPGRAFTLHIFATDLDKDSIDRARQGFFPPNIEGNVSPERLARYFVREENGFRLRPEIREMVTFAPQNLIMDPPFTKLDMLTCRNLLIYLSGDVQKKLLPLFHYSLNAGGVLLLGSAETTGTFADLFSPINAKSRIYRRLEANRRTAVDFPSSRRRRGLEEAAGGDRASRAPTLQALADRLLLDRYAPAAVLTNEQGDILYVSGRTGKFLEPPAGKANWNLQAMAREGLSQELTAAFRKAVRSHRGVLRAGVKLSANEFMSFSIEPLTEPGPLRGTVIVVFTQTEAPVLRKGGTKGLTGKQRGIAAHLEQELRSAREYLTATLDEMQTSQEELKSANEELQSTNEELQSTNEELTTSKEEMQSMNEELQTVNNEQQSKVDELSRSNDDLRNLLDSTDIGTLFLDSTLRVRRFTAQMASLIKLIPGDVNRPITDLASPLIYPELADDAERVLRTLIFKERPIETRDGRWYTVRIMPYRTMDDHIDGLVITFLDITVAKKLEATLRSTRNGGKTDQET